MTAQEKTTQLRVGIFMAIGLSAIALMVVYFGRFGDAVRQYYQIRVEYPNASGLLRGASVLLAGAKVGSVETAPVILPNMDGVYVMLNIYKEVEIPSASEFTVGSSGLLGDRFVEIRLKADAKNSPPIPAGAVIHGKGETGFSDIFDQVGPSVAEMRETIGRINSIAEKIDKDLMNKKTLGELSETIANIKTTSAAFADSSKKFDGLIQKADSALASGSKAAEEIQKTATDLRQLVQQAKQGRGVLGVLLSDKETADNLKALVANLRERGILWYKDKAEPRERSSR